MGGESLSFQQEFSSLPACLCKIQHIFSQKMKMITTVLQSGIYVTLSHHTLLPPWHCA